MEEWEEWLSGKEMGRVENSRSASSTDVSETLACGPAKHKDQCHVAGGRRESKPWENKKSDGRGGKDGGSSNLLPNGSALLSIGTALLATVSRVLSSASAPPSPSIVGASSPPAMN